MNTHDKLMDQLAAPENLLTAWRSVRGNIPSYRRQRSAGPDGVTLAEFERDLSTQIFTLRQMLLKGRYEPQHPGLFNLEKRSGGTRQIAILNVADRVVQTRRSTDHRAAVRAGLFTMQLWLPARALDPRCDILRPPVRGYGYGWVVDGDIAACFDSLDHRLLMEKVKKRIGDERVMDLLHKWLEIGVLEHGLPTEKSNWLEQGWEKASHGLRRGFDWTLNTINQQRRDDPYSDYPGKSSGVHYEPPVYRASSAYEPDMGEEEPEQQKNEEDYFYSNRNDDEYVRSLSQKRAFQQMAAGGLLLGTGWLREGISRVGPAALAALKSQAGREIVKRGLLIGGGALGTAAGLAVTAYFVYRQVAPTPVGVLQGSPLSPLLANIYLHSFDLSVTRAGYRLVRFADDWVILCPDQDSAEKAYNQSVVSLAHIHLKVNSEKTHILSPTDPLEWLGEVIA